MLKRNVVANYLGQAWSAAIGLAFVPLYIKYLGIESYGLIGLFAVLQAWMVLLDMGLSPALSREMARFAGGGHSAASIRDLLRSVELVAVAVAIVMAVGIGLSSWWLAEHWLRAERLPTATVAGAFQVMGLVTALRFVENIYRSSLSGLQRQVALNVLNSLVATVRSVGAVAVIALLSRTIEAFFLWQAAVSLGSIALLFGTTYRQLPAPERPARFSLAALRSVSHYAGGLLGISLLSLLLTQVDKILLSRLLTLSSFGFYSLATLLASSVLMLVYPIGMAFQPRMVELFARDDRRGLAETYHLGCQLVAVGAGSVAIVLAMFAGDVLRLWTGNPALAAATAPLLVALTIGNLLNGLVVMPYQLQLANGWTGLVLRLALAAIFVIIPALLVVTPRYGAVGAAWSWVALNAFYCCAMTTFLHRRLLPSERAAWWLRDVIVPLAPATAVASTARLFWSSPANRIVAVLALMTIGLAVLAAAALAAPAVRRRAAAAIAILRARAGSFARVPAGGNAD